MKVNMDLLSGTDEVTKPAAAMPVEEPADTDTGMEEDADDGEEDEEIDESDSHSKLKTALLVAAMVGGFALFVWNMTGFVNNMRMDSQGSATSIIQEMESLDDFMDRDGSAAVDVNEAPEREVPTDADRDGPAASEDDSGQETKTYENESEEMAALRKELDQAVKDRELTERELANAEKMLDAALAREAGAS
ncbi:hypothetical protein, partial [Faecalibaculum rodentium]|uniref:hypothetical protein n=1 Tax=Faecalibaculum rodentium TaxID=1702221 RepID=UPI00261D9F22